MKFDQIWMQAISEWIINLSVFVFGFGVGVYFAAEGSINEKIFVLTVDTIMAIVLLVLAVRLRR
jgi:hypothetical protein